MNSPTPKIVGDDADLVPQVNEETKLPRPILATLFCREGGSSQHFAHHVSSSLVGNDGGDLSRNAGTFVETDSPALHDQRNVLSISGQAFDVI